MLIELQNRASHLYWRTVTRWIYRTQFERIGDGSVILRPMLIKNPRAIAIGGGVSIRDGARLEIIEHNGQRGHITIGDDTGIEQGLHIVSGKSIVIGKSVTIAPRCVILDLSHPFEDLGYQGRISDRIDEGSPVIIGDQCFIGAGSVILPGVNLGERCVVGANSVVTRSMAPYTVCAGAPAKPLRQLTES